MGFESIFSVTAGKKKADVRTGNVTGNTHSAPVADKMLKQPFLGCQPERLRQIHLKISTHASTSSTSLHLSAVQLLSYTTLPSYILLGGGGDRVESVSYTKNVCLI